MTARGALFLPVKEQAMGSRNGWNKALTFSLTRRCSQAEAEAPHVANVYGGGGGNVVGLFASRRDRKGG